MTAPVLAILDLWALGHSARDIADRLGLNRHAVSRVVEQARDIGDPRAVFHIGKNGKAIGRPNLGQVAEAVPAIPALYCVHGHVRTPESVDDYSNCRTCRERNYLTSRRKAR